MSRIREKKSKISLPLAGLEPAFLGLLVQALTQYMYQRAFGWKEEQSIHL